MFTGSSTGLWLFLHSESTEEVGRSNNGLHLTEQGPRPTEMQSQMHVCDCVCWCAFPH